MKAIINRGKNYGWLDGKLVKNDEIKPIVAKHLKAGTAEKIVDTDETLMYNLKAE